MQKITKNAVTCTLCQSPADLINNSYYQCQSNPNHVGDLFVGIFSNLSRSCPACGLEHEGEKCPNGCQDTNRSGILIL